MTTHPSITTESANARLRGSFADCVTDLGISVESIGEGRATLRMKFDERLCRIGGIVCGQALSSLADTAMVFAVWAQAGNDKPVATVDLHVTFVKAARGEDVLAHAEVVRVGRTLGFARVSLVGASGGSPVATAVGTFAMPA